MPGAGLMPAGLGPAGFSTPTLAQAPQTVPLPDPSTGLSLTGRLLTPLTSFAQASDYVLTSDGRAAGMSTAQQMVQIALASAVQQFSKIKNKGSDPSQFQRQLAGVVSQVLGPIVKQGVIQILGLVVQDIPGHPDGSVTWVQWRDLTQHPNVQNPNGGNVTLEYKTPLPLT